MRKALRIIAVTSGIISVVSAIVLAFVYFEDIANQIKKIKDKISAKVSSARYVSADCDFE